MSSSDAKSNLSKRKQVRYAVSEDCRVRASILLKDPEGQGEDKEWRGVLVDVSAEGAYIQLSLAAVADVGSACVLKLALGAVKAEVRASVAHYVCSARYSICGVKFASALTAPDKPYHAFFRAFAASATLKGGATASDMPGRYCEEYRGPGHTRLVVWRDNMPGSAPVGFEYTMARYAAALPAAGADMLRNKEQVRFKAAPAAGGETGALLSETQVGEARWEFSLAASNLPPAIPPDIRRFLRLMS